MVSDEVSSLEPFSTSDHNLLNEVTMETEIRFHPFNTYYFNWIWFISGFCKAAE